MELNQNEKKVLNTLFGNLKGTSRNEMLCILYAAKPTNDGSVDSQSILTVINNLILKIYHAKQKEMEEVFAAIPFPIENEEERNNV
ncbi:MAG: hypothetical protein PHN26_08155 [Eubacteriaceae bacterium]|nr:hypothetical protein [Eubacteriaceae bacterium]